MAILTRAYERARTWSVTGYLLDRHILWGTIMMGMLVLRVLAAAKPTPWQRAEREAKAAVCARLAEQVARSEVELLDFAQTDCPFRPAAEALGLRTE